MAVTFTPNIGLAKPDKTELGKNWAAASGSKLCEVNNTIIANKMNFSSVSYTPAFVGRLSNPNIGSTGQKFGEYFEAQGFIFGTFTIIISGTGIAGGSGEFGISLPTLVDSTFHIVGSALNDTPGTPSVIGEGQLVDASAVNTSGTVAIDVVTIGGVSYARLVNETYAGKTGYFFGSSTPFVIADGDRFSGNFFYKKA